MKIKSFVKYFLATCFVAFLAAFSFAQTPTANNPIITEEIKVEGNCGQCQTRIEKACYRMAGVQKASWNEENDLLTVTYDSRKTTNDKIQASVAKFGHDTPNHKASDKGYKKLPECCRYREGNPHKH
jgi:copper chaperone CopZ